ncbi:MAG: DnaJ domain-containing protein [Myxococcales bacterium]|nr:DnaJ domain-containing protein [Myxococcales bacterium]
MQRELSELEQKGPRLTHYELLGVPADADGAGIRRAYLEKSKRFHPDAWYRKDLGHFGPLLSKWFQRLAAAYQLLSDEETRIAYDREHLADLSPSERAAVERRELARAEEERRSRERRERLLKTKGFGRIAAAKKLFEEAEQHAENGERSQAIAALRAARELDPKRAEIHNKLIELERAQLKALAHSALASAKDREERHHWKDAMAAYAAAFMSNSNSFSAAFGAARCAFEGGDFRQAMMWAQRACDISKDDPAARLLLARSLTASGMKARARAELQTLLARTPDHKEAKALLRSL